MTFTKCKTSFKAVGSYDQSREIKQPVTCPHCGELNEVDWPMSAAVAGRPNRS